VEESSGADNKSSSEDSSDSSKGPVTAITSSGRAVQALRQYLELGAMMAEIGRIDVDHAFVQAEIAHPFKSGTQA
jgi:hypothetical protein